MPGSPYILSLRKIRHTSVHEITVGGADSGHKALLYDAAAAEAFGGPARKAITVIPEDHYAGESCEQPARLAPCL